MKRAQLEWRCRRGMCELDPWLRRYLDQAFDAASHREKESFARLLEQSDDALWRYFYRDVDPEDVALAELVRTMRGTATPRS